MKLTKDVVGLLSYTLAEEDGTVLDETPPGQLFAYLHGHGNLPEGLEAVTHELEEGASFEEVVTDAFGPVSGVEPQPVHKRDLPRSLRDDLEVGRPFAAPSSDGEVHQLWVTAIRGARVWVTTEHPLAGKTLRFRGKVERVRTATASELEHGHAHGADGHSHHH